MISDAAMAGALSGALNQTLAEASWLVAEKLDQVETSPSECAVCGGLLGGILCPEVVSVTQETLTEYVATHPHWKHIYVEVFRVEAHVEPFEGGGFRVVPDDDQNAFFAPEDGAYRLAVHNSNDQELFWVSVGLMAAGDTLNTMALTYKGLSA